MVGKYPPIQGGVSAQTYWLTHQLAALGHQVHVVTNADEVEASYRIHMLPGDREQLTGDYPGGGAVRVHTTVQPPGLAHIPYANPYTTKLASLAADVTDAYGCDIIIGWYLEPYGFAASLAARWTNRPLAVRHAGSDLGRLAQQPDRGRAYWELLRRADLVLTGSPLIRTMLAGGVDPGRIHTGAGASWPDVFGPAGQTLDIPRLLTELGDDASTFDPQLPTIGVYGKIGTVKGTPQLINALARLDRDGRRFNLVFLSGNHGSAAEELASYLDRRGLTHRATMLPFLAPWRVPSFLRACTAVAVLENRFPIAIHQPTTALEVLSTGTCLVVSAEIRAKHHDPAAIEHGRTALVVDDPQDTVGLADTLRLVIDEPHTAATIGAAGADVAVAIVGTRAGSPAGLASHLNRTVQWKETTMSLQAAQAAMAKLYTDPAFRTAVQRSSQALNSLDLTDDERQALTRLGQQRQTLDEFNDELHHKLFEFAWQHFPTVQRHFPETRAAAMNLWRRQHDFVDRGWPAPIELAAQVITQAAREIDAPNCCADAVTYDLELLRAITTVLPDDAPTTGSAGGQLHVVSPHVRIIRFAHDLPALLAGTPPQSVVRRPVTIAFIPTSGPGAAVAVTLAPAASNLVQQATNPVSTDDLVHQSATTIGARPGPEFRTACLRALGSLHTSGVLTFAAGVA
ncbi:hypothetical protein GCM10010519_24390 [Streptomyces lactacystinicus]